MNVFIGELPPPYGGVAVKDKLMYHAIYEPVGVKFLNLVECKWKPWKIPIVGVYLIYYMFIAEHIIIGVGTNQRRKILLSLRKLVGGYNGLKKTHIIAMGGMFHETTRNDKMLRYLTGNCGSVWVETEGMKISLEKQGFRNVKLFPNCRTGLNSCPPRAVGDKIKYVYFSRICAEKGVDEIIEAVKKNNGRWSLDFYGEIASEYNDKFNLFLEEHPDVIYHGVFDSTKGDVYKELNQYDAILLPSKWIGEGVPGALVEAKMSGIAAIVSDWKFNSEIVRNQIEGVVLKKELSIVLNDMRPEEMERYKQAAYISRLRYCIDTYKDDLLKEIQGAFH